MVSRPSTPVKRPIRGPLSVSAELVSSKHGQAKPLAPVLRPDNAANEREAFAWRDFADFVTLSNETLRFGQLCAAIVMNCDERLAFFYAVANAFVKFKADGVVDGVFLFFAAAAESGEGGTELFAICCGNESCQRARDIGVRTGLGEKFRIIDDTLVAPLKAYHFCCADFSLALPVAIIVSREGAPVVEGLRAFAKKKHPGGEFDA